MWLPLQDSFQFDFRMPDPEARVKHFWVEKGASSPSAEGTHLIAIKEGDEWTGPPAPMRMRGTMSRVK